MIGNTRCDTLAALDQAVSLLQATQIDQAMRDWGWTAELATFVATRMSECRTQIAEGWTPPHMYGGQWIRLMMDRVEPDDDLTHAIYEASAAVNQLADS